MRGALGMEGNLGLLPAHREVAESLGATPTGMARAIRRLRERWNRQRWMTRLPRFRGGAGRETRRGHDGARACGSAGRDPGLHRDRRSAPAAGRCGRRGRAGDGIGPRGQPLPPAPARRIPGCVRPGPRHGRPRPRAYRLGGGARRLGSGARQAGGRPAEADPLLPPARVTEALAEAAPPAGMQAPGPDRILRLAVQSAARAAVSSRGELYPRGMAAARAAKLGASSLLGPTKLSEQEIRKRVASRYPEADPLPGRPGLDDLLETAGLKLAWDEPTRTYRSPAARSSYASSSSVGPVVGVRRRRRGRGGYAGLSG